MRQLPRFGILLGDFRGDAAVGNESFIDSSLGRRLKEQ